MPPPAPTVAVIVPLVLTMLETVVPGGTVVAVTVRLPAAVSGSLTVAICELDDAPWALDLVRDTGKTRRVVADTLQNINSDAAGVERGNILSVISVEISDRHGSTLLVRH